MGHNPRPAVQHPALDDVPVTALLHALADATRLTIVRTLHDEPSGRACGTFPVEVAPSTLSHHFKVLRESGVIHQENRGTQRWTVLRGEELEERFPGVLHSVLQAAAAPGAVAR